MWRAVAFATEARTGDVEIFRLDLGGLHAAAVILHCNGGFGEDVRHGDMNLGGLGIPSIIDQLLQRLFAGGVVLSQDMGELRIGSKVGSSGHMRQ